MSILTTVEAVPNRVVAVGRYLLSRPNRCENLDEVENALSPSNLRTDRKDGKGSMIHDVVLACVKLRLLETDGADLRLSEFASQRLGRGRPSDDDWRDLLLDILFDKSNGENHDLCRLMAWFLAQELGDFTGTHEGIDSRFRDQVGASRLGTTHQNLSDNFWYWAVYLGFAHRLKLPGKDEQLFPDPTSFLRSRLAALFPEGRKKTVQLPTMLERLALLCPSFEGGWAFEEVRRYVSARPANQASDSLSLALLRLMDKGSIELTSRSDAPGTVLVDGPDRPSYTHATWIGSRGGG